MHDLQHLARQYYLSIDSLRRFAFSSCGIPQDAPEGRVDLWLYERLATAANWMGAHFYAHDDRGLRSAIDFSLSMFGAKGSFEEKCAESWAELVANPIIRHEIMLHERFSWPPRERSLWEHCGAENETFCDVISPGMLAMVDDTKEAPHHA